MIDQLKPMILFKVLLLKLWKKLFKSFNYYLYLFHSIGKLRTLGNEL